MYYVREIITTNSLGNAIIALENQEGSNKIVRIKKVSFIHQYSSNSSYDNTIIDLGIINNEISYSSGEEITPIPFDPDSNELVTFDNIKILTNVAWNYSSFNIFRRFSLNYSIGGSGASNLSGYFFQLVGSSGGRLKNPSVLDFSMRNTYIQHIFIRPNQTFLIAVSDSFSYNFPFVLEVDIGVTTTSDDFQKQFYKLQIPVDGIFPRKTLLAIINRSNSEYKIAIGKIGYYFRGETYGFSPLCLTPIEKISEQNLGEDVKITKFDSNDSNLPSKIIIKKNADIVLLGRNLGIKPGFFYSAAQNVTISGTDSPLRISDLPYFYALNFEGPKIRQMNLPLRQILDNTSEGFFQSMKYKQIIDFFYSKSPSTDIIIKEGEGIAIVKEQQVTGFSAFLMFNNSIYVEVIFDIENAPPPANTGVANLAYI